jgi:hypothetical protein
MTVLIALSVLVAVVFFLFGAAKLFALAPMRERATHTGFSVAAFRGIGALVTHVRHRDRGRDLVPALVCAALVAGYLVALGVPP